MRILQRSCGCGGAHRPLFSGGPFTASIQIRFKKPANTAQTRIETRTCDPKLDLLCFRRRRLALILNLYNLIQAKKRGPFVSLQLLSRWAPHAGVKSTSGGKFVKKYPHVFQVFTHPTRRNLCCRFTKKFVDLIKLEEETSISTKTEEANVIKIKKILSLSVNGTIHLHAIRLIRRELGLPENFVDSIIRQNCNLFRFVDAEVIELLNPIDEPVTTFSAKVEKWREKEYTDKWLSEFETKYAFPISFPTGFRLVPGFNENLRNWQRLQFLKPYERINKITVTSCGGVQRYEKRAVGVIHELLCLTVEKVVEVERMAHFRKDLGLQKANVRELLLKHPGIFYLMKSTKFAGKCSSLCCLAVVSQDSLQKRKLEVKKLIVSKNKKSLYLRMTVVYYNRDPHRRCLNYVGEDKVNQTCNSKTHVFLCLTAEAVN